MIGARIKEARETLKISQKELALRVGVSQPSVSDWETGKTEPTVDNLRVLAVELEVFFEWLVTGREPRQYRLRAAQEVEPYRAAKSPPKDEVELLAIFRALTEARRAALLGFLRAWG